MSDVIESKMQPRPRRAARWLAGCGITLLFLLIAAGLGGWYVSRHFGAIVGNMVKERSGEWLNGRLEFSKMSVDYFGRATFSDVNVYEHRATQPVVSIPRAVVTLDLMTFFGPNRGRRAIVVNAYEPQARVVRQLDGGFNLANLDKKDSPRNDIGISLNLHDAQIQFTDICLLSQGYPQIPQQQGIAAKLLADAGYSPQPPAEPQAHNETLTLNGNVVYNSQRAEVTFEVTAVREAALGGKLSARGSASEDGSSFDITVGAEQLELLSYKDYVAAICPALTVGSGTQQAPAAETGLPYFAARVDKLSLRLSKNHGLFGAKAARAAGESAPQISGQASFANLRYMSGRLPDLYFPSLDVAVDNAPRRISADFKLQVLGLNLAGTPRVNMDTREIGGRLSLAETDLNKLLAAFDYGKQPLTGNVQASASLKGTLDQPEVSAELSGGMLKYGKLELGQPSGTAKLNGTKLTLSGVKFSGGKLPLKAAGSYDTKAAAGSFTIGAGPLSAKELPAIIAALSADGKAPKLDASGMLELSAIVNIKNGKSTSALRATSKELTLSGQRIRNLVALGSFKPPSINIESIEGQYTAAEVVKLAGFESSGPLSAAFRLGGSVSQLKGQKAVVALSGKAETSNLKPEQAKISFKLAGPADYPEIRAQLKTAHAENPLAVSLVGHYREGWSPLKADLTWYATTVHFEGKVDLAARKLEGGLKADAVDLARFAGDPHLSGVLSAKAQLGGTFDVPSVTGQASLPRLAYATPRRTYEITDFSAGFKLAQGDTLSISDGSFKFEGNKFTAEGILGKESKQLTLKCQSFNLFSALALVPPQAEPGTKSAPSRPALDIKSAGALSIIIQGDLQNPRAAIAYASGAGSVEGHAFESASLSAAVTLDGIQLGSFEVKSPDGRIKASGQVAFTHPGGKPAVAEAQPAKERKGLLGLFAPRKVAAQAKPAPAAHSANPAFSVSSFSGEATIENFDVAVLAPLSGVTWLKGLSGRLQGTLDVAGKPSQYSADGSLKLTNGKLAGVAISEASAQFSSQGKGVAIKNARVIAQGTELTASGVVGPTAADTKLSADIPKLDLALVEPFLPAGAPRLAGIITGKADIQPGHGEYPDMQFSLRDTGGGLKVGDALFNSASAEATLASDVLTVKRCDLVRGKSSFSAGGKLHIGALSKQKGSKPSVPLDVWLKAESFKLDDIAPLVPEKQRGMVPDGVVSCDLTIAGTRADPLLSGTASFDLTSLPDALAIDVSGVSGQVSLSKNDLDITRLELITPGASGLATARVSGGGKLSFSPLSMLTGQIDIALAPHGQFTSLVYPAKRSESDKPVFNGTLGGLLKITGSRNGKPIISGQLVVTAPGQQSFFKLLPQGKGQAGEPTPVILDKLQVMVQPTTFLTYKPVDLQVKLQGELTLSGQPGVTEGPDKLTIKGELTVPDGSMYIDKKIYRLTIRLVDPNNKLEFTGGLFPLFTGRGVLVLPRAIKAGENLNAGATQVGPPGGGIMQAGQDQDLKVYFNFKRANLDPASGDFDNTQKLFLTSDPPLSAEAIQAKLLGQATDLAGTVGDVLGGHTELSQFAEQEAFAFGSSFISRAIEREFDLKQFTFGGMGSENSPFFVDVEKQVAPDVSLTYFRNFYTNTQQKEEFGIRYQFFEKLSGSRYQNVQLELNFAQGGVTGSNSEFMFKWTTKF